MPGSFADLVERVTPAVVNVSTVQGNADAEQPRGLPGMPEFPPGSPFEEFFKQFQEQQRGARPKQHEKQQAQGSGFIVDAAGYVVTNNHVIDGAEEITVTTHDGAKLDAKLVGRDPKTDLALLKVEAGKPLPYLEFGDSDKARVGDWVIAIGNPFGLGGTVTSGIVSARGRDIQAGPYDDFLQLDASINRGNSGGPTFDAQGRVIGINTAIFSPNGGSRRHRLRHPVQPRQGRHRPASRDRNGQPGLAGRPDPAGHAGDRRKPWTDAAEGRAGRRRDGQQPGGQVQGPGRRRDPEPGRPSDRHDQGPDPDGRRQPRPART